VIASSRCNVLHEMGDSIRGIKTMGWFLKNIQRFYQKRTEEITDFCWLVLIRATSRCRWWKLMFRTPVAPAYNWILMLINSIKSEGGKSYLPTDITPKCWLWSHGRFSEKAIRLFSSRMMTRVTALQKCSATTGAILCFGANLLNKHGFHSQ